MTEYWMEQFAFMLRIVVASICGMAIGFERKNRLKAAGTRTHLLVALASALMMVISKYGFFDVITDSSINLDPSRIAAGIVTGISFLGAGMIFVRKQEVSGITTAAGVWATVGVGMAIGAGMYVTGVFSTLLILLYQKILHSHIRWFREPIRQQVSLSMGNRDGAVDELRRYLTEHKVEILAFKVKVESEDMLSIKMIVKFPLDYEQSDIIALFEKIPHVVGLEI